MAADLLQHSPALDNRHRQRYGIGMIEQFAKLQSDVEYIKRDIADIKADLSRQRDENRAEFNGVSGEFAGVRAEFGTVRSEFRTEFASMRGEFRDELRAVRERQERDFRLLFGALISLGIGLASVMAKSFGWF